MSGVSSVNFNGLFLGNPVTGTYKLQTDCSMTWSFQDDSGNWQHFEGNAEPGGGRAEFHQTDEGTANSRGVLERTPAACNAQTLLGHYALTITGRGTPFETSGAPGRLSAEGTAESDGAGNLALTWSKGKTSGTYSVDSDCTVQLEFGIAVEQDSSDLVKLRGVVVNGGREVLAVQTDPERVAVAKLVR